MRGVAVAAALPVLVSQLRVQSKGPQLGLQPKGPQAVVRGGALCPSARCAPSPMRCTKGSGPGKPSPSPRGLCWSREEGPWPCPTCPPWTPPGSSCPGGCGCRVPGCSPAPSAVAQALCQPWGPRALDGPALAPHLSPCLPQSTRAVHAKEHEAAPPAPPAPPP